MSFNNNINLDTQKLDYDEDDVYDELTLECNTEFVKKFYLNKLEHNNNLLLLDIRESTELPAGYIPQAQHLALSIIKNDTGFQFTNQLIKQLSEFVANNIEAHIVFYCAGGVRSLYLVQYLYDFLIQQHHSAEFNILQNKIYSMQGGFKKWVFENKPTEDTNKLINIFLK